MNTSRHQRPLVFISFPFLAVIVLVALLASLTTSVFNKFHQRSRPHQAPAPAMTQKNQH